MQRLGGHIGTVTQVSFGDNNLLASASNDKTIIVSELPDIFLWAQVSKYMSNNLFYYKTKKMNE